MLEARCLLTIGVLPESIASVPDVFEVEPIEPAALSAPPSGQASTMVAGPDLMPYQPAGWSGRIVVSSETNTNIGSSEFTIGDNLYVDASWINFGDAASGPFETEMVFDGGEAVRFNAVSGLNPSWYSQTSDVEFDPSFLSVGLHTVEVTVDVDNDVTDEADETNNVELLSFQVDLPSSWVDVSLPTTDILTADATSWLSIADTITSNDTDIFRFTTGVDSGVFVDLDSREIGLSSTLDSAIAIYDSSGGLLGSNDDGFDFEGFVAPFGNENFLDQAGFFDSSLYLDLSPGTYFLVVRGNDSTSGDYNLRLLADTNYTATVPALDSFPSASDALFLDFDGHNGYAATDNWGTYTATPFDFNSAPAQFSPGERLAIQNVWRATAEDYSPFAINVTTIEPATFGDGQAYRMILTESGPDIIGRSGVSGIAWGDSYAVNGPNNNVGFVFASDFGPVSINGVSYTDYAAGSSGRIMASALEQGNTAAHEFGHALGLDHFASDLESQSDPGLGVELADIIPNAIIATRDIGFGREIWASGTNNQGVAQDDVAVISNTANTFGYRSDDHADTTPAATELTPIDNTYSATGIISDPTVPDRDVFRFSASAATTITVDVDEYINNLDVELRLYDTDGSTLLATDDPTDSFDASLSQTLASGTYFVVVQSDGETGELGQYSLAITTTVGDVTSPSIDSLAPADESGNVSLSTNLTMTFDEPIAKGSGNFVIRRSSDNTIFETIDVSTSQVTVSGTQATINPSANLAGNTGYYVQVDAGALTDMVGNPFVGISNTTTWNFTTIGVLPNITSLTPSPTAINESGVVTLTGAFTDPNPADSHTVSVDWGDGSAIDTFSLSVGNRSFSRTHPYLDDGLTPGGSPTHDYSISVTVNDGTYTDTDTTSVTVNNRFPTLSSLFATPINENDSTTLSGAIGDVGTLDTFTVRVDWGDNSGLETFSYPAGTTAFSATHPYLDDDPSGTPSDNYTIEVLLTDDDTGTAFSSTPVTVSNIGPTVDAGLNQSVNQGETVQLGPATFTDPGTLDTHTATIDWGDGTIITGQVDDSLGTVSGSHIYTSTGTHTVTVAVTDDDTGTHSDTFTVQVASGVPNITSLTSSPTAINENGVTVLTGAFTDPNSGDTHTATIDWGDGGPTDTLTMSVGSRSFSRAHTYLDDGPTPGGSPTHDYSISVTVSDGAYSDVDSTSVTVHNRQPTLSGLSATPINENDSTTLSGAIGDVGTLDTFTVRVDWGDNSGLETFSYPAGTTAFSATHPYLDDDPSGTPSDNYTIEVLLTDDDTGTAFSSTPVTVSNIGPTVDAGLNQSVNQGEAVQLGPATFTDPGTLDTHTATIDWGDGTIITGQVDDSLGTVSGSHIYTSTGTHTVTVAVTDDDTGTHSDTFTVQVASGVPNITSLTSSPTAIDENGVTVLTGAFTDPNSSDTHTATIDWGDGGPTDTLTMSVGSRSFSRAHTYLDDGLTPGGSPTHDYSISVTVSDGAYSDVDSTSVTVHNRQPTLSGLSATSIGESGTTTLSGTLGDVGTLDTFTVRVDWGDNSGLETFSYPAGTTAFSATHPYLDDDPSGTPSDNYTIEVLLTDDDTGTAFSSTPVTVSNIGPTVDAGLNQSVNQGEAVQLGPATFTDPGTLDTHTATIDWGDGTIITGQVDDSLGTVSGSHIYTSTGTHTVTVAVTDDDTGTHSDTFTVQVASGVPNITSLTSSPTAIDENGVTVLTGAFTDPNSSDTHTATIDWGDGGPTDTLTMSVGSRSFSRAHTYLDDGLTPGGSPTHDYSISVTVSDGAYSDVDSTPVTVHNRQPTLSGLSATSIGESGTTTLSGTLGDVGTLDTFTVQVDWGDNSGLETFSYPAGTTAFSATHPYLDDDPSGTPSDNYTIEVLLTDDDTGTAFSSTPVTVSNIGPTVDAGLNQSVNQGETVQLGPATFTDPGTLDTHTATIDWGDGTIITGQVDDSLGTVSGSHIYTSTGTHTVTVAVTDDDTGTHSDTFTVQVASGVPNITSLTSSPTAIDENGVTVLTGAFTDPNSSDTHTATIDWGDGGPTDTLTMSVGSRSFSRAHTYLDDGLTPGGSPTHDYSISVTVSDGAYSDVDSTSVTVHNRQPTLSGLSATSIGESGTTTLSGTLGDVGTLDTFTVRVDWGDNSGLETFSYPAGTTAFSATHPYLDDDPSGTPSDNYTIEVLLTDDDTGTAFSSTPVTVSNIGPTVDAGLNQSVNQGEAVQLGPATFTDPGTLDTHTATIDWGDGTIITGQVDDSLGTVSGSHIYTSTGTHTVTVAVTDDDTGTHSDTFTVQVASGVPNITSLTSSPTAINENGVTVLTGAFTDPNSGDTHTATIDWGDGGPTDTLTMSVGSRSFSRAHTYLDDGLTPGGSPTHDYSISVTVSDGAYSDVDSTPVTVHNRQPTLSGLSATSIGESGTTTLSGTLGDVGTLDTFTVRVDWGDNSGLETFSYPAGTTAFSATHSYLDDDPSGTPSDNYTIEVLLTDDDTGTAFSSTPVTVSNIGPTVDAGLNQSVNQGETVQLGPATFTDPGTLDTHTATIDWGDGTIITGQVDDSLGTVSGSHIYTSTGTHTVTVAVTDDDTGTHSDTFTVQVAGGVSSTEWVETFDSGDTLNVDDEGRAVAVDELGNVYVAGVVAFDGSVSNGPADIFVAKYASDGTQLWQHLIGGSGDDRARGIALDSQANVYITGYFQHVVDFDPGTGVTELDGGSFGHDGFVLKLDTAGNFVWANRFGQGSGAWDWGNDIEIGPGDSVYLTGFFAASVDFDPSAGQDILTSAGSTDAFVQKLDSNGSHLWVKAMGGTAMDHALALAVDEVGNVYSTGDFSSTADFDPDSDTTATLTSAHNSDVFVSKLDASGNYVWAGRMGGHAYDGGLAIDVDASGNLFVGGKFQNGIDLDPDDTTGAEDLHGSIDQDDFDAFVVKLDTSGSHVWGRSFGGFGQEQLMGVQIDTAGGVLLAGTFDATPFDPYPVDFDPSPLGQVFLGGAMSDGFVSRLDSNGALLGARDIGGSFSDNATDVAMELSGDPVITGHFSGTVDFDTGDSTTTVTSTAGRDLFVLQLIDTTPPTVTFGPFDTLDINPVPSGSVSEAGARVVVTFDGVPYETTNYGSGTWTMLNDSLDPALSPGVYDVVVTATDIGGNIGSITTTYELVGIPSNDFGDAPAPYPTLLADNGPRHEAVGPQLGATRDAEADGQPSPTADGDDITNNDEDGVTFGTMQVGQLDATVTVNVQNAPNGAKLDAWIDFNGDGSWGGPFEHIADSFSVIEGDNAVTFDIPSWALASNTYARFRLSYNGGLGPAGLATNGEVEDYQVTLTGPASSNGQFGPQNVISSTADGAFSVFAVDIDGDGDMDILSASIDDDKITWYENEGNQGFTEHLISAALDGPYSVSASDLDGDGDMDVLSASVHDDKIAWYENDGSQGFTEHTISITANGAMSVSAADVDADGDMDVLSASIYDDKIAWYENDGGQVFTEHVISTAANGAYSVFASDVDSDGDMDILSASFNDDTIAWYENDGNQGFTEHMISVTANGARSVFSADLDGDGDMDVLSASSNDAKIAWYENDGNQTFTQHTITSMVSGAWAVKAVDLDGDGDLDVLSASASGDKIAWYENDGNESFTEHTITLEVDAPRTVFAADMDSDGDLDVLSASQFDDKIAWYENGWINPQVTVTAIDSTVAEPADDGVLRIARTGATDSSLAVDFTTNDSTATRDIDYQLLGVSGDTVTIPAGQAYVDVTLDVIDDILVEGVEDIIFSIVSGIGYDLGTQSSVAVDIADDDTANDFGDAPVPYSTLLADNGARHASIGPQLGATRDAEADGQPNTAADGDDILNSDDEDGVTFGTMQVGQLDATVTVNVQNAPNGAKLDAWIDFNADGDWDDPGETIADSLSVIEGDNAITFDIPADALEGDTYARFRLSYDGGLGPVGLASNGEVEDYQVTLTAHTWFGPPEALNTNASTDSGTDHNPVLTTDRQGNWVSVWSSADSLGGTIGTDYDILFARSTDNGESWSAPQALNTNADTDTDLDQNPQLATDGQGNWVAVWQGGANILFASSTDAGQTWTPPQPLSSAGSYYPDLTTDGQGNWVSVWFSVDTLGGTIGSDTDILFASSTDAGQTWTSPQPLNTNATTDSGPDSYPDLTTDGQGNWVSVWLSQDTLGGTIGGDQDILFASSTDAGQTWTSPQPLNTNATTDSSHDTTPDLTTDGQGNWVSVWNSSDTLGGTIGGDQDILFASSTDAGQTWTSPQPLNTNATTDSGQDQLPDLTTDGQGNWVSVWQSSDTLGGTIGGTDTDILFASSTDAGQTWTSPQPLNTNATTDSGYDLHPDLTTDGQGNWVSVWYSGDTLGGTIGSDYDILFARAFLEGNVASSCNLDVDLDGEARPATDGILILRYLFGFTDTTLIDDVHNPAGGRTDPVEIVDYLDSQRTTMLDVDGDGEARAATDGILILRYMFGFTGDTLIQDVVNPAGTRTTEPEIVAFLDECMPPIIALMPDALPDDVPLPMASSAVVPSTQLAFADPVSQTIQPNSSVSVVVKYDTLPSDDTLTTFGLRLHYNSTLLTSTGVTDLFTFGQISAPSSPTADTQDFDNDSTTDTYIMVAWIDIMGNWPGSSNPLPLSLFTANFTAQPGFTDGTTSINFSPSDTAFGWVFDSTSAQITVQGSTPPVANPGGPYVGSEGIAITFDGSASTDDIGIVAYEWDFDYQPGFFNADATGVAPSMAFVDDFATRTIALRVEDTDGAMNVQTSELTVINVLPIVNAGANQSVDVGQTVSLLSAGFSDPGSADTHTATVSWGDGTATSGVVVEQDGSGTVSASHQYTGAGTYSVVVTVTDDGGSSSDSFGVTVTAVGSQVQQVAPNPISQTLTFDQVPGGEAVSFDVVYSTQPANPHLTGLGFRMHFDSSELTFNNLSNLLTTGFVAQQVQADTANYDSDSATDKFLLVSWSDLMNAQWPGVDTTRLYTANFTATSVATGSSTVRFSTASTASGWDFASTPATVNFNHPPVANAGGPYVVDAGSIVALDASASADLDQAANTLLYLWDLDADGIFGETGVNALRGVEAGIAPVFTAAGLSGPSTHNVTVRVTDAEGASALHSSTVTVQGATSGPFQIVEGTASQLAAPAGSSFQTTIQYSASDNDQTLSGLGMRMHYNSSVMTLDGLTDILPTGFVQDGVPEADADNLDGDSSTDTFVLISWASTSTNWPNTALPIDLFTANFTLQPGMAVGATSTIRMSRVSTAPTHDFQSQPITVTIAPPVNLDVDGNCEGDALTDGILILRYLFEFTGEPLVENALAPNATRTDPTEVENFLDVGLDSMLDVDGNGEADALTDGIIILRYLFEFTGSGLVENALGPNATRTDPNEIESYLDTWIPACASQAPDAFHQANLTDAALGEHPTTAILSDEIYTVLAYEAATTPSSDSSPSDPTRMELFATFDEWD